MARTNPPTTEAPFDVDEPIINLKTVRELENILSQCEKACRKLKQEGVRLAGFLRELKQLYSDLQKRHGRENIEPGEKLEKLKQALQVFVEMYHIVNFAVSEKKAFGKEDGQKLAGEYTKFSGLLSEIRIFHQDAVPHAPTRDSVGELTAGSEPLPSVPVPPAEPGVEAPAAVEPSEPVKGASTAGAVGATESLDEKQRIERIKADNLASAKRRLEKILVGLRETINFESLCYNLSKLEIACYSLYGSSDPQKWPKEQRELYEKAAVLRGELESAAKAEAEASAPEPAPAVVAEPPAPELTAPAEPAVAEPAPAAVPAPRPVEAPSAPAAARVEAEAELQPEAGPPLAEAPVETKIKMLDWQKCGEYRFYTGQTVVFKNGKSGVVKLVDTGGLDFIVVIDDKNEEHTIFAEELSKELQPATAMRIAAGGDAMTAEQKKDSYQGEIGRWRALFVERLRKKKGKLDLAYASVEADYGGILREYFEQAAASYGGDIKRFLDEERQTLDTALGGYAGEAADKLNELFSDWRQWFIESQRFMERKEAKQRAEESARARRAGAPVPAALIPAPAVADSRAPEPVAPIAPELVEPSAPTVVETPVPTVNPREEIATNGDNGRLGLMQRLGQSKVGKWMLRLGLGGLLITGAVLGGREKLGGKETEKIEEPVEEKKLGLNKLQVALNYLERELTTNDAAVGIRVLVVNGIQRLLSEIKEKKIIDFDKIDEMIREWRKNLSTEQRFLFQEPNVRAGKALVAVGGHALKLTMNEKDYYLLFPNATFGIKDKRPYMKYDEEEDSRWFIIEEKNGLPQIKRE